MSSAAATGVLDVEAVMTNPAGSVPIESPWLIQHCVFLLIPLKIPFWFLTKSSANPYSRLVEPRTFPPRESTIYWRP